MAISSRKYSRFLRYSLRSLLAVVTLAAVLAWLYRQLVIPHHEQQEFLAAAAKIGAKVTIQPWRSTDRLQFADGIELGAMDRIVAVDLSHDPAARSWHDDDEPKERMGIRGQLGRPYFEELIDLIESVRAEKERRQPSEPLEKEVLDCLKRLPGLYALERLNLTRRRVADDDLRRLSGLKNLQRLELWRTLTTDAGLKHLATLSSLKRLGLTYTGVTDDGIAELNALTNLEALDLRNTELSAAGIKSLALPNLTHLCLADSKASGVVELGRLPRLEYLDLSYTKTTAIKPSDSPALRAINLNGTELTDDALRTIAECPSIQRLAFSATSLTAAGLAQLKKLPHLEELCLDGRLFDQTGIVAEIASFPSLKTLQLVWYGDSEDAAREAKLRNSLPARITFSQPEVEAIGHVGGFGGGNPGGGLF